MIRDRDAYERWCERESQDALRALTVVEAIAIGEALLTSELMDIAAFPNADEPKSLAIALGIAVPRGKAGRAAAASA